MQHASATGSLALPSRAWLPQGRQRQRNVQRTCALSQQVRTYTFQEDPLLILLVSYLPLGVVTEAAQFPEDGPGLSKLGTQTAGRSRVHTY